MHEKETSDAEEWLDIRAEAMKGGGVGRPKKPAEKAKAEPTDKAAAGPSASPEETSGPETEESNHDQPGEGGDENSH